ncbi:hypothetical protein GCM10023082_65630 [Streptomyces tremellae]|uniref:Uncharacterized protein n=1 Tax=Streptomyces tremellae TaxID=1124239 RepID=A0ABP7GDN9_9ACTN
MAISDSKLAVWGPLPWCSGVPGVRDASPQPPGVAAVRCCGRNLPNLDVKRNPPVRLSDVRARAPVPPGGVAHRAVAHPSVPAGRVRQARSPWGTGAATIAV